jgi:signal recognition particle subunit SRP72
MPPKSSSKPVASKTATTKIKNAKAKTPAKPKQPLPEPERLKQLFTSLCAQIDGGHLANAVKTCDKSNFIHLMDVNVPLNFYQVLRISPADADALQTKLFLLLQTERYAEALALASEGSEDKYAYERAYTLYRLQREDEAKGIVEQLKNGEDERGVNHLEAQMVGVLLCARRLASLITSWIQAYRQGHYDEAIDLYQQLLDSAEPVGPTMT